MATPPRKKKKKKKKTTIIHIPYGLFQIAKYQRFNALWD